MIKMSQCHILEQTQDNAVADIPLDLDNNRRASLSDIFFSNSGQESPVLGKTDLELGEVSVNHVISKMAIKTLPDSSPVSLIQRPTDHLISFRTVYFTL